MTCAEFLGVLVLFHRFGQLRGWLLPEAAMFYGDHQHYLFHADAIAAASINSATCQGRRLRRLLVRPPPRWCNCWDRN